MPDFWDSEFALPTNFVALSDEEKNKLEARNSMVLALFVQDASKSDSSSLDLALVRKFHHIAVSGLQTDAGDFRRGPTGVSCSHTPPKAKFVSRHVEEMCDYANAQDDMFHRAAFLLWRVNWIHPFTDGNGRVARACCYMAMATISDDLPPTLLQFSLCGSDSIVVAVVQYHPLQICFWHFRKRLPFVLSKMERLVCHDSQ